jgi:hypothetical protein
MEASGMNAMAPERRKGHYLGTEIDEKWWKRHARNKMPARGIGEYWFDDTAFYFRRYLTQKPIQVPFDKIVALKIGSSHSGRWVFKKRVLKIVWKKGDLNLSSGFIVAANQQETEAFVADFKRRLPV